MRISARACGTVMAMAVSASAATYSVDVSSGPGAVALIELYTSEGCSSCPPGEAWLSTLAESPRLWRDFVPVAFHVDYWDRLGWRDPLGNAAYSDRQRRHASRWRSNTIYTPGFVLQGEEWRVRRRDASNLGRVAGGGVLRASGAIPGKLRVEFTTETRGPWIAHAAILGNGIDMDVSRGENKGRRLRHDFVVLERRQVAVGEGGAAEFGFDSLPDLHGSRRLAIAVWVERDGSTVPVQSAGGWLTGASVP